METSGRILPNFELIQASMHVLIACKYEKDQMKNSGENVMTLFFSIVSLWDFFQTLKASQLRSSWSDLAEFRTHSSSYVYHHYLYKYEMNPIINVRENVMTPFFPLKPYLLPWKPVVASDRISNSFKLLYMSSLPANMKRIQSKIAEKM